jgi:transcriptional regulator NrdR family protein
VPVIHTIRICFPLVFLLASCQYIDMVCIYCSSPTQVTNSRLQKRLNQVWRRRHCTSCGSNFTTHEAVEYGSAIVVQYSPRLLKPFSRDLLFISVYESCKHRSDALADATALTQTIIGQLLPHVRKGIIDRDIIATVSATVLERFDKTAATMYGAFHPPTAKPALK